MILHRFSLFFLIVGCSSMGQLAAQQKQPNILFIFTDDQSHRTVSAYEDSRKWIKTPNIDRLAKEGIRFKHAFAGPWCAPSRAMFLTGKHLHGIQGLDFVDYPQIKQTEDFRMWPEVFRKNGYTTAVIGKWHLASDYRHGQVWDHSIIWERLGGEKSGDYFRDQKLRFDGGDFTPVDGHSTDNYTNYAVDFVKRDHEKPWILWLCYDAVHAPFTPADRHQGDYGEVDSIPVPEDIYPPRPTKPAYMQEYSMFKPGPDGVPVDDRQQLPLPKLVQKYNEGVLSIDEGVADLLETLKATGQLDNTIIAFSSDQGIAMGHHGMEIKVAPYDDNIRVPFIVRLPDGSSAGRVVDHPVNVIDLVPTFFDYAGIDLPWRMHGDNIRPLLEDSVLTWDRPLIQENFSRNFGPQTDRGTTLVEPEQRIPNQNVDWWIFTRYGKYKYIQTLVDNEIEELYDIENDPRELTNLALDPAYRSTLTELRSRMLGELDRMDAGLVKNLPEPKRTP
ncbi:MAG: sulfatase-like hydrolase/transferase [Opitutales bacterium]|nr:sulfatase-like hydrolase/transferase [Opitutales bacterium]